MVQWRNELIVPIVVLVVLLAVLLDGRGDRREHDDEGAGPTLAPLVSPHR